MNHQDDECTKPNIIPRKIRLARNPAIFICLIQCAVYIFITGAGWFGSGEDNALWVNLFFIILWGALAFGIYKYSRTCAVTALLLYVIEKLSVELIPPGQSFSFIWLIATFLWLLCLSSGIIACWKQHKYKKKNRDDSERVYKQTIILVVIVLALFHSAYFGMKEVQKHTRNILWQAFYQSVMEDKSKIPLPMKINNNLTITDIYFEQRTLIVEHQVSHEKLADLPIANFYAHARKLYSRYCANDVATSLDLTMIVRFAQGYETRDLTFTPKDCQFKKG